MIRGDKSINRMILENVYMDVCVWACVCCVCVCGCACVRVCYVRACVSVCVVCVCVCVYHITSGSTWTILTRCVTFFLFHPREKKIFVSLIRFYVEFLF